MRNRGGWRRLGTAAFLGAVAALAAAPAPAHAHVRVDDGSAPGKGGYGVVRLNVPSESDTASTVGLTVTIPDDVVLTSARVLPIAGWSAKVETAGERVTRIVWRAENGLTPSQFGVFTFSAGPWPENRSAIPLPTSQQYSDGSVVAWDEVALDASEPEHPAPIVVLGDVSANHHGAAAAKPPESAATIQAGGSEAAQWFLIGLAVVLSAIAAGASLFRRRR